MIDIEEEFWTVLHDECIDFMRESDYEAIAAKIKPLVDKIKSTSKE